MKITYLFDPDKPQTGEPGAPEDLPLGSPAKNKVFMFMVGDVKFTVQPGDGVEVEVPAQLLRADGDIIGSGVTPVTGGRGPHEDYQFMEDSTEYTYTIRKELTGSPTGGVIEKIMPAGAKPGKIGVMHLYKGITTVAELAAGEWTERLIRTFIITEEDIAEKDTGWPESGDTPTIDLTKKIIEEGATKGDGFLHI